MSKLEQKSQQLRKFVLVLSGAHEEVLTFVPSERARFESLGWAVLITSGMATVSMWFALSSAVGINGILALPVALGWGLVIMGIDRWLIVSMPVGDRRKFALAVPRLALALLLGTLISTPLVLRIFQSEINAQIAKMQQQSYSTFLQQQQASDVAKQVGTYSSELQYLNNVIATHGAATANTGSDPQLVAYNKQLGNLDNEVTHWTSLENQYYTEYTCQLYGGPACPKKGYGPAAKDSQKNYQAATEEVGVLKGQINQVQGQIAQRDAQLSSNSRADQQARYEQALTQQPIVKDEYDTALQRQNELQAGFFASNQASHGILIRLEALGQLSNGNFTVTAARFLLFLLFLVIECLPVTVKLLQQPGVYEEALEHAREAERRDVSKFYRFRSRLSGPNGTALLRPTLRVEPEYRIDAIWTPTRALPGSAVAADDQPTERWDDPSRPPWAPGGQGSYGQGSFGQGSFGQGSFGQGSYGQGSFGQGDGQADGDRPEQRWYGADRWRNHWQDDQPAADDDPPPQATRRDVYRLAGPAADPGDVGTRVDYGQAAPAPADDREGLHDSQGLYDSQGYRVLGQDDAGSRRPGSRDGAAGYDDDDQPGGQPPKVSPGTGGTTLSWDDEE